MSIRSLIPGLILASLTVLLDQWTKNLAVVHLIVGLPREILPVFNLTLQHNPGAAFSFLAGADGWQRWLFTAISSLISVLLIIWIGRLRSGEKLLLVGLSLILGGALGNLWDRLVLGYVVDFISVHYQSYFFPAFNIADSAITIGAGLLILDMWLSRDRDQSQS